jgi:RimJ/RimL family protein N-acetyltransferase
MASVLTTICSTVVKLKLITKMVETERFILKPLSYQQLVKYINADNSLELELNLQSSSRTISQELKEALEQTILPTVADTTKDYLYSTLWTVILKDANKMVGDICIVGEPNENGEIEIGYGTYNEFQKQGLMTEAVGGMINWAKSQTKVNAIVASTEKDNFAYYTVLLKNNFIKTGQTDLLFNWQLQIK